jgi:hypothetical protein
VRAWSRKAATPVASLTSRGPISPATPSAISSTLEFYLDDFNSTLFPLKTNREIIQRGEPEIKDYIKKCLDENEKDHSFLAQRRVYAAKPGQYLRRTVKLDPVAEYYIYDLVFRNRSLFRKPHSTGRTHYGYRFEHGVPIAATAAYQGFKGALAEYSRKYSNFISFDVASYFNSVYHHDLIVWFAEFGASNEDSEGLGQLLRQMNSGRSVDCLPQGLYPTKMIGNDFLRFVDNYHELKSDQFVRFMDDMYLFSPDSQAIGDDFQVIQRLLGEKGLTVNPQKTRKDTAGHVKMDNEIDAVKQALLKRRRQLMIVGYDDAGEEIVKETMLKWPLSDKELKYIDALLNKPDIEEDDAELILAIMRDHAHRVEKRIPYIIRSYPHLTKNVYSYCSSVADKEVIADMILTEAKTRDSLMEFQLFWFGAILEDHLMHTSKASALISVLFNHRSATSITKAKILEIADARFGLPELRNEFLVGGQSDWLAWSSAVGSRSLKPISRNHRLKYFGNSSQINHLIATIMLKADPP